MRESSSKGRPEAFVKGLKFLDRKTVAVVIRTLDLPEVGSQVVIVWRSQLVPVNVKLPVWNPRGREPQARVEMTRLNLCLETRRARSFKCRHTVVNDGLLFAAFQNSAGFGFTVASGRGVEVLWE